MTQGNGKDPPIQIVIKRDPTTKSLQVQYPQGDPITALGMIEAAKAIIVKQELYKAQTSSHGLVVPAMGMPKL